jgi:hypothetical protein
MKKPTHPRRITLVLRSDLTERVFLQTARLYLKPNYFINLCVEGCLAAMESEEIVCDIPVVSFMRKVCRKPLLAAKWIRAICALFAANPEEIPSQNFQYLADLLNEHEGPLTREKVRSYWRLADRMAQEAVEYQKDLLAFKSTQSSR